jgi:hypothetical protein
MKANTESPCHSTLGTQYHTNDPITGISKVSNLLFKENNSIPAGNTTNSAKGEGNKLLTDIKKESISRDSPTVGV